MSKSINHVYAIYDRRKYLSVAEGVALWRGIEPSPFHKLPADQMDFKRLVQETLFLLGYRSKRFPHAAPLIFEPAPREGWIRAAESLCERPPAFFPEERHRRKRRGLDRDIQTYEAVHRIMKIRECPKERAYDFLWRLGDDENDIKPRSRKNPEAIKSSYWRGERKQKIVSKVSRNETK